MTDFQKIYKLYSADIYRFAYYLCKDVHEAEDITAETFARIISGKSPLKSETVKSYLFTIARNLFLEGLRRKKREQNADRKNSVDMVDPETSLNEKDELNALQRYLDIFAESDRTALLLRAEGFSYQEIAQTLSLSLASAKVKVHRMRLKLAEWRANREK
ncbi:MAG: hypothetical protein SCALA702_04530 [Melioribacteraceae bacterium]|nr:MAG: hypothetical protein SCALA702_04530 [Melioribacteraceae bacterium]